MGLQLSISVATMQVTRIKISEGVRKGKFYVGIHDTAHAPVEYSHGENIFCYQGRIVRIAINVKLNNTAQKMLWGEAVHTCERIRNSMSTTGSTTSQFENYHGEKLKIIGLLSEFGRIGYVIKLDKFKEKMTDKKINSIKAF